MKVCCGRFVDSPTRRFPHSQTSLSKSDASHCNTIFTLRSGTRYPVLTLAQI